MCLANWAELLGPVLLVNCHEEKRLMQSCICGSEMTAAELYVMTQQENHFIRDIKTLPLLCVQIDNLTTL